MIEFNELQGQVLTKIEGEIGGDEIIFIADSGKEYKLYHEQDCCESVYVEDIEGDFDNLLHSPLLMAEEVSSYDNISAFADGPLNEYDDSYTWTFYKLATAKGYVTIRWYGVSNGYYSESVDFVEIS